MGIAAKIGLKMAISSMENVRDGLADVRSEIVRRSLRKACAGAGGYLPMASTSKAASRASQGPCR